MNSLSWSYSGYSAAARCLKLFRHQYLDKLEPDYQSGDMAFGSALHSAINAALTGDDASIIFEIYWNSYKDKELMYGRYKWADLAEIGAKFVRNFVRLHSKRYVLEFAEERLYAEYNGVRFEGTPDFYGIFDDRRSLRDFKTSSGNYDPAKGDIALQLNLYTYLVKQSGREYPATLGYTVFNKVTGTIQQLTWDFSESRMFEMLDDLVAYTKILGQDVYPKNGNACLDYNRKCAYWSKCYNKEIV